MEDLLPQSCSHSISPNVHCISSVALAMSVSLEGAVPIRLNFVTNTLRESGVWGRVRRLQKCWVPSESHARTESTASTLQTHRDLGVFHTPQLWVEGGLVTW